MSTLQNEPFMQSLLGRLAELERTNARLQEEVGALADNPGQFSSSDPSQIALWVVGTNGARAINCSSDSSDGIAAFSTSGPGVTAVSTSGNAINAFGEQGIGVAGVSDTGIGVVALSLHGLALSVRGTMQVEGSAVGQVTLTAGQTSVTVSTPAATPISNILLTPLGDPQGQLWVTRVAGSFTIQASAVPTSDVPIGYLVIN